MKAPEHIVIFHPAAIGDSLLATPVARALKLNFPQARVTWWAHPGLRTTLAKMCPYIDTFVDYMPESSLLGRTSLLRGMRADLFVDLSNSAKGKLIPGLSFVRSLHYRKRSQSETPAVHAVDNFLETVKPICSVLPDRFFPTIFPPGVDSAPAELYSSRFRERLEELRSHEHRGIRLVGLVPGVGRLRPNRSWPLTRWTEFVELLKQDGGFLPVLIGGIEDSALVESLAKSTDPNSVINLCGSLDLHETAAVLERCQVVVSGDTGPAHITVAVGRPVVGLYGPTRIARSGPYGCAHLAINRESSCQCTNLKSCRFATIDDPAGKCMAEIGADEVMTRIVQSFASNQV